MHGLKSRARNINISHEYSDGIGGLGLFQHMLGGALVHPMLMK